MKEKIYYIYLTTYNTAFDGGHSKLYLFDNIQHIL
jgi:hypothetical protein